MRRRQQRMVRQAARGAEPRLVRLCCIGVALVVCACGTDPATPTAATTTVNITALPIEPTALAFYAKERGSSPVRASTRGSR